MKHTARRVAALLFATALCRNAEGRTAGRMHLEPRQDHYYVGQTVRWLIELEVADAELGGAVHLENMPTETDVKLGRMEELPDETRAEEGRLITLKRFAGNLRLLREGSLTLRPALRGTLAQRSRRGSATVWTRTQFQTPLGELRIDIQPLPTPAPPEFSGAIGQFRLRVEPPPREASTGDLVNLAWWIEGFGSLENFRAPPAAGHPDLRVYPARIEIVDPTRRADVSRVLVPMSAAVPELPAVEVGVFDPVLGRYRTLYSGPFPLALAEPEKPGPADPADPALQGLDPLQPALPEPSATPAKEPPQPTAWLRTLAAIALALALAGALLLAARSSAPRSLRIAVWTALAALLFWRLRMSEPTETVTLSTATEARLAPALSARRLSELPAGLTATVRERSGDWARIEFNGSSGWIPAPASAAAPDRRTDTPPADSAP